MKTTTMFVAGILASVTAGGAVADMLYSQGFEDDSWLGGKYFDVSGETGGHYLTNNVGEAAVTGPGFGVWMTNDGLADGDYVGVTNYTGNTGGMYEGNNAYQMSDTDGMMQLIFNDYDLNTEVNISLAIFIATTGYEDADSLNVWFGSDTLLQLGGGSDGGVALEDASGIWILIEATGTGSLSIAFESNSASEAVFIDAISISTGEIPAPGVLALLGIAGLAQRRRR